VPFPGLRRQKQALSGPRRGTPPGRPRRTGPGGPKRADFASGGQKLPESGKIWVKTGKIWSKFSALLAYLPTYAMLCTRDR